MLAHMKKRPTKQNDDIIRIQYEGNLYEFPKQVADKYRVADDAICSDDFFKIINKKYSKPGALLKGLRIRDNLTQRELAKKLKVTQSDVSQMENGVRNVGRTIAKRIAKLMDVDYRSFLD